VNQPWFWTTLLVVAALAVAVRLRAGRPLLPRRAQAIPDGALLVAAVSAAALVFHCAAMFFAPWLAALIVTGSAISAGLLGRRADRGSRAGVTQVR